MATNIKQQGCGIFILDGGTEVKSSILWDEETTAWKYFSNSPISTAPTYYRTIPTLYRGISIISNEVQNVPFSVFNKSGKEIDNTEDWQNLRQLSRLTIATRNQASQFLIFCISYSPSITT